MVKAEKIISIFGLTKKESDAKRKKMLIDKKKIRNGTLDG